MALQLDDLAALDVPTPSAGLPLHLAIDRIDEDPEQPRREFEAAALQELAETIRERGVRQPISVRPNLLQAGRWVLNFGARRLRASRLAGLTDISAFIDTSADSYDQVIENEQREGLKPLELALFVQKRLTAGDKQAEIARRLGKSRQWVTLATALIEAPDWLLQAYREGRCRGMNELYELRRLHGEHPQAVEAWMEQQSSVTRDRIAALRDRLVSSSRQPSMPATEGATKAGPSDGRQEESAVSPPGTTTAAAVMALSDAPPDRPPRTDQRIHVEFDGQDYQLVVSAAPDQPGHMYVRPLTGGPRRLAPVSALKLLGFVGT